MKEKLVSLDEELQKAYKNVEEEIIHKDNQKVFAVAFQNSSQDIHADGFEIRNDIAIFYNKIPDVEYPDSVHRVGAFRYWDSIREI